MGGGRQLWTLGLSMRFLSKKGLAAEKRIVYDVHNDGIDEGCRG